jgi:hypothetical protein
MRISHLALFVTVVALTACGGRGGGLLARGTTVNPIVSGSVTGQPLVIDDDRAEARHGLGAGTVTHSARMIRADAGEVCFEVQVSAPEDEGVWANPAAWEARLISSTAPDVNVAGVATVMPMGSSYAVYPGTMPQEQFAGNETYCSQYDRYNNCIYWATRPVYRTIYVPYNWTVNSGVGQVCWPNSGVITNETTWVRLRMVDPSNPTGRTGLSGVGRTGLNFEWDLAL